MGVGEALDLFRIDAEVVFLANGVIANLDPERFGQCRKQLSLSLRRNIVRNDGDGF
jgi:hypothetical protein